jgi:hypothetical protein
MSILSFKFLVLGVLGDKEGLCPRERMEELDVEIKRRSYDERSILC